MADQFLLMRYVGCATEVAMFADSGNSQAVLQNKQVIFFPDHDPRLYFADHCQSDQSDITGEVSRSDFKVYYTR